MAGTLFPALGFLHDVLCHVLGFSFAGGCLTKTGLTPLLLAPQPSSHVEEVNDLNGSTEGAYMCSAFAGFGPGGHGWLDLVQACCAQVHSSRAGHTQMEASRLKRESMHER
eukprot:186966-Chlamydomonas_euryale.AAC.5